MTKYNIPKLVAVGLLLTIGVPYIWHLMVG